MTINKPQSDYGEEVDLNITDGEPDKLPIKKTPNYYEGDDNYRLFESESLSNSASADTQS